MSRKSVEELREHTRADRETVCLCYTMPAMALTMSSAGAVSGMDTHIFAGAGTTAQGRYHNRPLRLSTNSALQETLLSRCLAGNVSTNRSGKGFGSGRRRRQNSGSGSKRRVFCRCAASGEMGKDDSDNEQRNSEEINDEVVGTSGSGNQPRQKKSQVRLLILHTLSQGFIHCPLKFEIVRDMLGLSTSFLGSKSSEGLLALLVVSSH